MTHNGRRNPRGPGVAPVRGTDQKNGINENFKGDGSLTRQMLAVGS